VEVANAKPLPLAWLRAEDEFPTELRLRGRDLYPGKRPNRQVLDHAFTLRGYERVRRRYHLRALRRGAFDFGPVTLISGDVFGFRTRSAAQADLQTVLVYPKVLPLRQLHILAARPYGDQRASRWLLEDPLLLAGARDYQPGDSLRHVHWKATARRGRLQSKAFEASAQPHLMILLNGQTIEPAYLGTLPDRFEGMLVVAASLASAALGLGYPLGVQANIVLRDSHARIRLPASRNPLQLSLVLEALAQATPFQVIPFEQMLALERPALPFGATVLVVSSVVNERIAAEVLALRTAGHPTAFITLSSALLERISSLVPTYLVDARWEALESLALD
jgi:uncharacterized protein (DUF58 family)